MLILVSLGFGALGFILLWLLMRPILKQTGPVSFEVMERLGNRIALRNPPRYHWLSGLSYSSLFYFWLPILIWRYGIYRALFLIIVPISISLCATFAFAGFMNLDSTEKIIYGFFTLVILRAIFGVKVVAANDLKYRRNALILRGWKALGSCEATSKKEAIKYFQDLIDGENFDKKIDQSKGVCISDIPTKICIRCRQEKPLSAYYLKLRDDYVHECIDCRLTNSTCQSTRLVILNTEQVKHTNPAAKWGTPSSEARRAAIERAVLSGTIRYILGREKKIDEFVKRHYSFRGALKIHSHAVGLDIIRVPINIVWSVVNIFLALVGLIAKAIRLHRVQDFIKRIPPGLKTDMDKQIGWLIITELLELPHKDGLRISTNDALMAEIMEEPDLRNLIEKELEGLDHLKANPKFKEELTRKLAEYGATRIGAADLASNVVLLVTSKFAIGQASFGALSAGSVFSASVAHSIAVSNFWLGTAAGSFYYTFVPVAVSMRLLVAMTALISVVLALVSTFIGIFTDPIQAKLGLHHSKLRKLVKAIEKDLLGKSAGQFQLREKYIGRVFDIVDFLAVLRRAT